MEKFYTDGTYFQNNPTWDAEDAEWKYKKMLPMLNNLLDGRSGLKICEIGCGGGKLLGLLAKNYPNHQFIGWDLAPEAERFWKYHLDNLTFFSGDIFKSNHKQQFDLVLLIDVVEHVENPHQFLENVKKMTKYCFFHMPLDLSAISVLFDYKLLYVRRQVGHIHYFTKSLFLELLREVKLQVLKASYSDSWKDSPKKTIFTKVLNFFRFFLNLLNPDLNVRLLGANTLFVLTETGHE